MISERNIKVIVDVEQAKLLHRALTATGEELLAILQHSSPDLVQIAFKNPALGENQLLLLLKRKDLSESHLKSICKLGITESSHSLKVALAMHPATPAPQLLTVLPYLYLFELLKLCLIAGSTPDQKLAAERTIIQRLTVTPLGNKLTLARRGSSALLEALLKEGDPRLVEVCLTNPRLKEAAVFQFLRGGIATAETISLVARSPRWQSRTNLREAILTNPKTPLVWFTLWLPALKGPDLKRLLSSSRLTQQQKDLVAERIKKRK